MKNKKTGDIAAIVAESFDFLVDAKKRLIGLEVEPKDGARFVLPMSYETAEQVAMNLLKMLLFHAPEMAQARLAAAAP
jgi:thymidylate synthase ThyX